MPRSYPHRSKKAVQTLAARQAVARQRLDKDLRYLDLLWLDASPNLRLSLIKEFARMLGIEEKRWGMIGRWLKGPTRKFQRQRESWHGPGVSEAEHSEQLETQWIIVPGNNNPVCLELTFGFLGQLKSLPENRKEKIRDYFSEAYIDDERSGRQDPFKTDRPAKGRGAPKREERADRIRSAMKAAMIRYAFEPEKSWTQIGIIYFGLKPGSHKRPGNTLQRYVKWLGELVYNHIAESIWTWTTRSQKEKKEYRQRIAREWGDFPLDDTALDEHLAFDGVRRGLRDKFFFPQLPVPRNPRRGLTWWNERNARLLTFLAKTLFHVGRTGKLTIPESFRPKQPF